MDDASVAENEHLYQIGTASSLSGVDAHTIRAWERRYGAIKPMRSASGRRRYDDHAIERLQLLKALVDCNEAIGTIAHLPDEALRERLAKLASLTASQQMEVEGAMDDPARRPRLLMFAPSLAPQLAANAVALSGFEFEVDEAEAETFLEKARTVASELVLLEVGEVNDASLTLVRACVGLPANPRVVVIYRFASTGALAKLGRAGATLCRAPIRLESLRRILEDQAMIARSQRRSGAHGSASAGRTSVAEKDPSTVATRRFDDAQLARLLEVSSALDCECPNHLSSLVSGLVSFESYSRRCASRDAEDAAQHQRLANGTARARAEMEALLAELCEHEGIRV